MSKEKNKQAAKEKEEKEQCPETQTGGEAQETQPEEAAALLKKLEELTRQNAELSDRVLRTAAEFDNFRKRTQKEKAELTGYNKAGCIKEILVVVDSFERALAAECKDSDFKKGMEMIFQQLVAALTKLGAQEIEALGQKFNPELHNAIKQVEDEAYEENTVCEVLQKGYRLEDRVIRHSVVVVANP